MRLNQVNEKIGQLKSKTAIQCSDSLSRLSHAIEVMNSQKASRARDPFISFRLLDGQRRDTAMFPISDLPHVGSAEIKIE